MVEGKLQLVIEDVFDRVRINIGNPERCLIIFEKNNREKNP